MTENTIDPGLAVIVLAAGQGTRMKSALPEGAAPHRRPARSSATCSTPRERSTPAARRGRRPARARPGRRGRRTTVAPERVIVDQDEVPGHRPRRRDGARRARRDFDGDVLVLSGDVPLLDADTLAALVAARTAHGAAAATVLSAIVDDATGYGRVIRDADGAVDRIVEQKDATRRTRHPITEINAGIYVFRRRRAARAARRSSAPPTRRARSTSPTSWRCCATRRLDGRRVRARRMPRPRSGVNDRVQLAEAARVLNARTCAAGSSRASRSSTRRRRGSTSPRRSRPTSPCCPTRTSCRRHGHRRRARSSGPTRASSTARSARTRRDAHRRDPRGDRRRRHRRAVRLPAPGHATSATDGQDRHVRRDEELDDRRPQQGAAPVATSATRRSGRA